MYNYSKKISSENIKKKCKSLLLPYILFGIIIGFFLENIRIIIRSNDFDISKSIILILTGREQYLASWFLLVLFGVYMFEYMISYFLQKMKKENNKIILTIIHIILLLLGIIISNFVFGQYFKIQWILVSTSFFYLGYLLKDVKLNSISSLIIIIIGAILALINSRVTYSNFEFGNWFLFYISSIATISGLIFLIKNIYICKSNIVLTWIEKFGNDSIIVLLTHLIYLYFIRIIEQVLNMPIHTFPIILSFIIIIILEIITIKFMPSTLKKLFGK